MRPDDEQHDEQAEGAASRPDESRGRLLKLKLGYNPNSSSVGSVVSILMWTAATGAALFNVATTLVRKSALAGGGSSDPGPPGNGGGDGAGGSSAGGDAEGDERDGGSSATSSRPIARSNVRFEDFGAIIALDDMPALAWVDRAMVRELGYEDPPIWNDPLGHLSAPTEVHLMTTNRCPAGCPGCYTGATPDGVERPTDEVRRAIRQLAEMGVFHLAMGGGESMLRDDLFDLAAYARSLGMIPNLTTSGIGLDEERARRCRVFGQVNVSLDGVGETYRNSRGYDGSRRALRALSMLHAAGVPCGVNYVVSKRSWDAMEETAALVAERGGSEIEFLRFKPGGRGADVYADYRLDEAQANELLPRLMRIASRHDDLSVKIDCSLVPLLCAGDPDPATLERFAVFGCEAGHVLSAVKADLTATPCSFIEEPIGDVSELASGWSTSPELSRWRGYHRDPPQPCASCTYSSICKGGCRAVAQWYGGDPFVPDPECPRVRAHQRATHRNANYRNDP